MAGAAARTKPVFQLGQNTFPVSMSLHKENRERLCDRLKKNWSHNGDNASMPNKVYVFLQGGTEVSHGGSDCAEVFRQESYFHWAFGGLEPDCFGAIDVASGRCTYFTPRIPDSVMVYVGQPVTPEKLVVQYGFDEVQYTDQLQEFFNEKSPDVILTLKGLNTDSGQMTTPAHFEGIEKYRVDDTILYREISECRVLKTDAELDLMRYINKISSEAHRELMRKVRPGWYEYQAESLFHHYCYTYGGMRHVSYTCIGASGCNCSVLHYGHAGAPNERLIKDGDMCLFDMGGEYYCYASDITCSFPANGHFTEKQRLVYTAVYEATQAVLKAVKPGVSWPDMHRLAERKILETLAAGGVLSGKTEADIDAMMAAHLGATFMPHGLGHLMGVDTHDVGGYLDTCPERPKEPGVKNLRFARKLEARMVITVEPGCYFIDFLLDKALASPELSKFLVPDKIAEFRGFGGVRIEEDIIITNNGHEMLTDVPRTIKEIESFMAGSEYKSKLQK